MTRETVGRVLRLFVVLVCAVGGISGFSAGCHATSHVIAGAATPGHHHPGGHAPQILDEGTQQRSRRWVRVGVVRTLPLRPRATWVGLVSAVRRAIAPLRAADTWAARASLVSSPTLLCICRT
jgi:hypothetical protein